MESSLPARKAVGSIRMAPALPTASRASSHLTRSSPAIPRGLSSFPWASHAIRSRWTCLRLMSSATPRMHTLRPPQHHCRNARISTASSTARPLRAGEMMAAASASVMKATPGLNADPSWASVSRHSTRPSRTRRSQPARRVPGRTWSARRAAPRPTTPCLRPWNARAPSWFPTSSGASAGPPRRLSGVRWLKPPRSSSLL
mmetsp:Transcript_26446/g.61940  ORF Transcript_26446/g.61940 Transcript_26446/m.61940 type:complete len:201 (+) Transcript_26446:841-1443(+)